MSDISESIPKQPIISSDIIHFMSVEKSNEEKNHNLKVVKNIYMSSASLKDVFTTTKLHVLSEVMLM